ncbi:MAG: hypothetical protein WB973_17045 [Thermoanaerobaculia bacterium]
MYDSIRSMERDGKISKATADAFTGTADRQMQMPPLHAVAYDPQFICVLLDQSGSMKPLREAVIEGHAEVINAFRKSATCRNNALFIAQYVFSGTSEPLNGFRPLSEHGNDDVVRLTESNYTPAGVTALYQTVHGMLQDTLMVVDHCGRNEGLAPSIYIMLVTDGDDTEGKVDPADIRRCLTEMRDKGTLGIAGVLGVLSDKLTPQQLENIRATLGFDVVIPAGATAKELRDAMGQFSKSIADRLGK